MKLPSNASALVTGAGSGFGRAISLALAQRGARVLVTDVDEASLAETAALIERAGGTCATLRVDVRDPDDLARAVDRCVTGFGSIDVLVNNAGVAVVGHVGEVTLEDWRFEVDVNLMGVIYGCHHALPVMKRQKRGFVLNVASAAGLLTAPMMGPYNVTKAAVIALSETLRTEVAADGIVVSALCPTFFRTNIHKAQRSTESLKGRSADLVEKARWSAEEIAERALAGLLAGDLYIIPQLDGKVLWRAKRLLGQSFYALVERAAHRFTGEGGGAS